MLPLSGQGYTFQAPTSDQSRDSTGRRSLQGSISQSRSEPGGALRYRGGAHLRYVFRGRRGLFLRPPHVSDFVKEGYFFVLRHEVWG